MKDRHLDSKNRLEHILRAISDIERFVHDVDFDEFAKNDMLHDAVLLQFIIIGEAIIHVENSKLEVYDYPWYKVRSFRNMIAHEYFNIKLSAVWAIIQSDLSHLKKVIELMLNEEFD